MKHSIMNRREGVGPAGPSSYICSCFPYKIYPFLGDINWVVSHWAPGWHSLKGEGSTSAGCFLEGVFHPVCTLAGIDWWGEARSSQMSIDRLRYRCWYVINSHQSKGSGFSSSHIAPGFWWLLCSSICGKISAVELERYYGVRCKFLCTSECYIIYLLTCTHVGTCIPCIHSLLWWQIHGFIQDFFVEGEILACDSVLKLGGSGGMPPLWKVWNLQPLRLFLMPSETTYTWKLLYINFITLY